MKKTKSALFTAITAVAVTLALTACNDLNTDVEKPEDGTSGNETADAPANPVNPSEVVVVPSAGGYVFTYNGYDVVLGSLADDLLAALGTPPPENIFEAESCGFHGIDYMYSYPGVQFNTFSPKEGEPNYILSIVFTDDTLETPEGACIGVTSREDIVGLYGEPAEESNMKLQYIKDRMSLSFMFDDGDMLADVTYYFDAAREFEVVA